MTFKMLLWILFSSWLRIFSNWKQIWLHPYMRPSSRNSQTNCFLILSSKLVVCCMICVCRRKLRSSIIWWWRKIIRNLKENLTLLKMKLKFIILQVFRSTTHTTSRLQNSLIENSCMLSDLTLNYIPIYEAISIDDCSLLALLSRCISFLNYVSYRYNIIILIIYKLGIFWRRAKLQTICDRCRC